jgi:hypothetical protein
MLRSYVDSWRPCSNRAAHRESAAHMLGTTDIHGLLIEACDGVVGGHGAAAGRPYKRTNTVILLA